MQLSLQRGQTLPFWTIGTLIALSMLFFLANYADAVIWQFRAQNAADSAAATALAVQSNLWNEESTILYATALDENRIRYLNQALLNTINSQAGGGCDPSSGGTCDQDYQSLLAELNAAVNGYVADTQMLAQGNNFTEAGQQSDEKKAIAAIGSADCAQGTNYTCDNTFTYTIFGPQSGTTVTSTDVVACKKVSYFASKLLNLGNAATYEVIGRAASAVLPVNIEAFKPGLQSNPFTGQPYQPKETQWDSAYSAPAYDVDFSGLTVNLDWYASAAIHPYAAVQGNYTC